MKISEKYLYWLLVPATALMLFDEWMKAFALQHFPEEHAVTVPKLFMLAIHKNWGIAFDLPFRREFILFISLLIGAVLIHTIWTNLVSHPKIAFSSALIVIGALGNLFDRIVYGFTVDYLIFFSRSAVNLSDTLIIAGVVLLLISSRKSKHPIIDKLTK